MISWFKYPFIRLLIPFALGIYVAFSSNIITQEKSLLCFLLIIFLFVLLVLTSLLIKKYQFRCIFAITLFTFLMLSGYSLVEINNHKMSNNDTSHIEIVPEFYLARLTESPSISNKSVKVMMNIYGFENKGDILKVDSDIMAYYEKDENSCRLEYGDCVLFFDSPSVVNEPSNPEQFNYKDYLYKKGVLHQVYIKSDKWLEIGDNKSNPIYRYSYKIRDYLLVTMRNLGITEDEYSVASAILLGYDETLPQELRQKYVAAGAMHILCVSGLHVGVIFMMFSHMLFFLNDKKKYQRLVKQLILLSLIWFYALLAGLAPSILRATIMLSFVIIGNVIDRKGVLLNSLASSAFILLCANPANLFDIGFLLSYVAVVGIVVMQKPISKLFCFKYAVLNKLWEITSVTIAAQIATLPFTIYYFHQFPIYFWLSNLFMTPLSSIVIVGGMVMLLVSFVPLINVIVAFLVSKMIAVMNFGVSMVESLPFSIIKGLYISELQFLILLLILLSLLFVFELRSKKMLLIAMISMVMFGILNINNLFMQQKQNEMVVFSINNMTAIGFINGKSHVLVADSAFLGDRTAFLFNVENYLVSRGVYHDGETFFVDDDFKRNFVEKRKNIVTFNEMLIGLSDGSDVVKNNLSSKIILDYMIVYGRKLQTIESLLNMYSFDNLIIDSSVPYYLTSRLIEEAERLSICCYNVKENGAIIIK